MADGYVQVPPDSSGKKIDTTELQTTVGTVERQRVAIPDGVDVSGDLLTRILVEQRVQNLLLAQAFSIQDDIEDLANEIDFEISALSIGSTSIIGGTSRRLLYDNGGVIGETDITFPSSGTLNFPSTMNISTSLQGSICDFNIGAANNFSFYFKTTVSDFSTTDTVTFAIDASQSTITSAPAFKVILPATGLQKAFQLSVFGQSLSWGSFEYFSGTPGFSLGSGSSSRDLFQTRSAASTLAVGSTAGGVDGIIKLGNLVASTDPGSGVASTNTFSGANSTTISTGVGSVKMSTANPGTNTGWLKCYIGTQVAWIPTWTTNAP